MEIHLDRKLPIPLVEQIKGQIKYGIAYGQLSTGELLPSVRQLADRLNVAPLTVARAYHGLSEEGLVESRPRSGTFVAEIIASSIYTNQLNPSQHNLRQILVNCVCQAKLFGHTNTEICETFLSIINASNRPDAERSIVLVGNFHRATTAYAKAVENFFNGLNVKVIPIVLDELKQNLPVYIDTLSKARMTITIATRLNEVRALLEPEYSSVITVAFQLSPETRTKLSQIHPDARLGLVTTYPEFLQTMLDETNTYCLLKSPPICAIKDQISQVKDLLKHVDILLYASGSEDILQWVPDNVEVIEYLHAPVPESLNRLRPLLA